MMEALMELITKFIIQLYCTQKLLDIKNIMTIKESVGIILTVKDMHVTKNLV